jgi:hypothetical protein
VSIDAADGPDTWRSGFEFNPDQPVFDKIDHIIASGVTALALVVDWDGVVTMTKPDGSGGTSWEVLRRNMTSDEKRQRHAELFKYFGPLEAEGLLTLKESESWQRQALELLIGSSIKKIEADAVASNGNLRPGIAELFAAVDEVFINSAGEKHIIRATAKHHGLRPSRIFANDFRTRNGIVIGVHTHTLTHSLNKHTFSHRKQAKNYRVRNNVIVVGDNLHDAQMVSNEDGSTILRARVGIGRTSYITKHGRDAWQRYVRKSFEAGYDAVVIEDNVLALEGLLRNIAAA